jgi:membrane-associated protein
MLDWLQSLLADHGYWVIAVGVFLNNMGLPIPGDMTVVGGGFLAHKGILAHWMVVSVATAACFMGGNGAYWLGRRYGDRLLKKISWLHVEPRRVHQMEHFFERYGDKAVFFSRFIALLHPVTGFLAGMGKTPLRPFLFYNFAGSAGYAYLYSSAGFYFGQQWGEQTWLGPFFFYVVMIITVIAILWLLLRHSIHTFLAGLAHKK